MSWIYDTHRSYLNFIWACGFWDLYVILPLYYHFNINIIQINVVLNEISEPVIFIFKIYTNKVSIHIDVEFHNKILILSIIKMPSKYLLVKFTWIVYCTQFSRFRWFCVTSLLVPVRYVIQGYFLWKPNYSVREFWLHFRTMALEKSCVVTSSEDVSGFPTMAPETSLHDSLGVHGATG